tara:strand:- start:3449 stop:4468 length:1020 start_codon:yes stop_codon:yes gene_type:complete
MVDANPQQEGRRRFSPDRFKFVTPTPVLPPKPWEHGKSWFEINLPNLLQTATQLSLLPLELVAPGLGMAAGAVAGQGAQLATKELQGRDVGKDDLVGAAAGAGTGLASAGMSAGMSSMKESMKADELAQRTEVGTNIPVPDTTYKSQLAKDAGVGEDFFSRDYITGPGGEVINNPSYDQLAAAADQRMATAHYGNIIGQGQDLAAQQRIANQQFGGATGFNPSPQTQQNLQNMYPGLEIPESTRQPALALGESAFSGPEYQPPVPAPMPTSGGGNLQSAMPVVPPTTPQAMPNPFRQTATPPSQMLRQPGSPYDVYRQQNPYFDPNNPFATRLAAGRRF